jgi:hypothetical protein
MLDPECFFALVATFVTVVLVGELVAPFVVVVVTAVFASFAVVLVATIGFK